jgi:hypothetical protein
MTSYKTLSTIVKEKIVNMSDNFNDKEILNYVKESIKEAKIDVKSKKVSKTNNIGEKPKYSLSAYQEFMKEQQVVFKEKFPDLSSKERLGKIAEEWNKVKLNKKNMENDNAGVEEVNNNVVVDNVNTVNTAEGNNDVVDTVNTVNTAEGNNDVVDTVKPSLAAKKNIKNLSIKIKK